MATEEKWVLIVDDEKRVAFFLEESLKALGKGLAVVSVGSAEEALEQLARRPFDLVVTDLRMPGMDGLELMQQVKETHPHTRTILITAYGSEEVEAEARRLESASYLTKPFPVTAFTQAVEQALQLEQTGEAYPLLRPGWAETVRRALATLRRGTGARCALLADGKGRVIAQVGTAADLPLEEILSALAEGAAITTRLEHHLKGGADLSLHHYEGEQYQVYVAIAANVPLMLVLLNQQPLPRRSGIVWLFLRRTFQELRESLGLEPGGGPSCLAEAISLGSLTPAEARALGLLSETQEVEGADDERE